MRVLVTGSAGRIGRLQVQTLQESGHEVRGFDKPARRKEADWDYEAGDLRDIAAVRRAVAGVDAVIHAGAIPDDRSGYEDDVLSVNVQGTWNVLLACLEAGVGRVVYYSSVNSLGNFKGYRPTDYLPIDDAHPHHPMTAYQLSKHLAEEACRSFTERYGIVTICLRPVYVAHPDHYSNWRRPDRAGGLERAKDQYWSYVDVRDVCQAGLLGLKAEGIAHAGFLLTADDTMQETPTAELVDRFYPGIPWKQDRADYLAVDAHRSLLDCSQAKQLLGWQPAIRWRDQLEIG